ncbi:hybrid sensor histidine kinase/response regulator transcription factor [Flavilitoribacter nigricans]|uniref:histidine kinase n=1 Tax=Flavilitoribacter nigricans (strain ATCC 23147 / DSM 23189 / NBRC 102662 / NCIMB 1420 / SS-2) TaxID=1122177 RepID=A0A2D0N7T9_FLAN2|nr:hybrid sensor histidine kinase/response regulator transcription factor [Flavilitoribacter nigricans]PHN04555.1 hypothetical protein CRP01_21360 [Flavilitoribacter nigricans DSM 23189 = NBRC 102662]
MKHLRPLLLCACIQLALTVLTAQSLDNFSDISYFTSDNGLSQGEVTCIIEDQHGFLWIGTRGGLNRYNGYEFEIFKNETGNPNSLINNSIESLFEDRQGKIWIGTKSGGISCYNPQNSRFTHFHTESRDSNTISDNRVISIAESDNGNIWFGTWYNGLNIYDPQTDSFTLRLPNTQVSDILRDEEGQMWIASNRGLYLFDQFGRQLNHFIQRGNMGDYETIIEDPARKCIWIGTWQAGLVRFDIATQQFHQYKNPRKDRIGQRANIAYALFQDEHNRIWTGTWGGGLYLFDPETTQFTRQELATGPYQHAKKLYSEILCIFQDRSGIIWIGTNGGGLCKVNNNRNRFGLIKGGTNENFPSANPIWSILEDRKGTLWVGTKGNGFLSYSDDGRNFKAVAFQESDPELAFGNRILGGKTLFESRDGRLWAGTHHGLYQIREDDNGYRLERAFSTQGQSIHGRKISSLAETADGSLWVGTQQTGLNRILPGEQPEFRHYRNEKKDGALQSRRVSAMLEDRDEQLWVGTYSGLHLYLPEQDQFRVFTKIPGDMQSLSSNIIICLYEDRRGRLWIGTPNGLNLAIPTQNDWVFWSFQEQNGLPNNYIHGILEDDHGNLWISTNKGISKFNPDEEVFYNYDVNDGLQGNSFSEGAVHRSESGQLFFGGIYGLNYFHPDSIINNPVPPPVFITGLKIFNRNVGVGESFNERVILERSLQETEKITLSHRENVFTLEFTALNFRMPHKNTYRYRLLGLEEDWNDVGRQRNVTYTNLQPGTYTFEVNAANNNQYWPGQVARLQIRVLPPFWATWQAYVLYGLVIIGIFGLYHKVTNRQNQLKRKLELERLERNKDAEVAELKTRFFTNITHELRTPLTLITGPVEELLEQDSLQGKSKSYLVNIHHHTQRLLALVNQLLDFRKAESGNMELKAAPGNFVAFAQEVFLSFQPMADKKSIDFRFEAQPEALHLYFDRDKMEIVLCNLLSNAFKFTPAGKQITMSIRRSTCERIVGTSAFPDGCCEISIKDNGIGMSPDLVEKIFNRFYQIANADSAKMIGTGIGLSLVESIMQLHQGKVEVRAEPERGSEFTLYLPIGSHHLSPDQILPHFKNSEDQSHYPPEKEVAEPQVQEEQLLPPPNGKVHAPATLLLVEDNARIRDFIRSIFCDHYQVLEAENGKIGLQMARDDAPDLIISDVMMPEMDGINFCKQIKEDERTSFIPVILLTARTSNVFKVEGFHSGADAYVTKPFQPTVLRAQVAAMLDARLRLREYFSRKVTLQPSDIEITSEDEQFLKKAIQVVEDNLTNEDLGKDFLAQAMAMSPSSLYRRIKSTTDVSINAFIRSIRLRRAAQLLRNTQYNISEISYQVGFNDLKYFRKCFRKQFGKNPSEYAGQELMSTAPNEE